ncbi:hypothetical protein D9615_000487 [Tricholomella constricta]|uniref:Uncharacterized protein n=1 Tax=Tricholomella constricta TaxID=117010 RepID=A0A8H5HRC8_9AGAR|nr:hypothetical protein D9615_000487 [Tricholomella constricta]
MSTDDESPILLGLPLVNLLTEAVKLQLNIDELQTRGVPQAQDWATSQSYQELLDKKYILLCNNSEVQLRDYNRLIRNIKRRREYHQAVREWMSKMEEIKNACLVANAPSTTVPCPQCQQEVALHVSDLEHRLCKHIDVGPVAITRASVGSLSQMAHNGTPTPGTPGYSELEEGEIRESPPPRDLGSSVRHLRAQAGERGDSELMKSLKETQKGYEESLRRMKEYESARAEDVARLDQIDVKTITALDKAMTINNRLRDVDTVYYSDEILALLGSDEVNEVIWSEVGGTIDMIRVLSVLKMSESPNDVYGKVWKDITPSLALVDAMQPRWCRP